MKILSWNICSGNKNQYEKLGQLLKKYDPDIVCLQEVNLDCSSNILEFSKYYSIQAIDYYSLKKKEKAEHRLVLLSKLPILNKNSENKFSISDLTKISLWEKINKWQESFEFQYAQVLYKGKNIKIFNVHFEVGAGPYIRIKQFLKTTEKFNNSGDNFICGDFNIYGKWYKNILIGWAMGFSFKEMFIDERRRFQKLFKVHNLKNPFYRKITYPLFALQLDHILVPQSWEVKKIELIKNRHGSDHRPIMLEV